MLLFFNFSLLDPDSDPGKKINADPFGSGSTALVSCLYKDPATSPGSLQETPESNPGSQSGKKKPNLSHILLEIPVVSMTLFFPSIPCCLNCLFDFQKRAVPTRLPASPTMAATN